MEIYAYYGFNNFILSLGYRKKKIVEYFDKVPKWKIKFVDTSFDTNTGGRIKRVEKLVQGDLFFATYGDGLSDVNLTQLLAFHKKHKKIATLVSVRPDSQFGILNIDSRTNIVTHFQEKPKLDHWVNGGFFIFNRGFLNIFQITTYLRKIHFQG